jgi:ATP-dependent DNA helicase RecG
MPLPINIENLLSGRTVESERIEYKEGWNPAAIYRSICAFANDFSNIGGGYVIIGVKAKEGIPERPVKGIPENQLDTIQQQMIGFNNLIRPVYHAKLEIEDVDGKKIMVLWIPGGSNRPYEVPEDITATKKEFHYYIRKYASSVKASKQEREELISLANHVPFDDRANTDASLDDISFTLLKDHLRLTKSKLQDWAETRSKADILEQMELLSGPPEQLFPRNVALMMFSEKPERFFPYSRVEIVFFPNGAEDPEFKEIPAISGPVPYMIKETLSYLKTHVLEEKIRKVANQPESIRVWNYPYTALEEAVANALYHRDYQLREPVEIRIYPDSITILNYGGPDRSIKLDAFNKDIIKPRRYRNRRLGDFLKELDLTEGRATGIPTIRKAIIANGSPNAYFETDEDRSFFETTLFIHESFKSDMKSTEKKDKKATKKVGKSSEGVRKEFGTISERIRKEFGISIQETFDIICLNPSFTAEQIALKTSKASRTIEKHLAKLKDAKIIERKGPKFGGSWEIISE